MVRRIPGHFWTVGGCVSQGGRIGPLADAHHGEPDRRRHCSSPLGARAVTVSGSFPGILRHDESVRAPREPTGRDITRAADGSGLRVRALGHAPVRGDGAFVLYWMTAAHRTGWSFALDRAVGWARELGKPLVVLEALRVG